MHHTSSVTYGLIKFFLVISICGVSRSPYISRKERNICSSRSSSSNNSAFTWTYIVGLSINVSCVRSDSHYSSRHHITSCYCPANLNMHADPTSLSTSHHVLTSDPIVGSHIPLWDHWQKDPSSTLPPHLLMTEKRGQEEQRAWRHAGASFSLSTSWPRRGLVPSRYVKIFLQRNVDVTWLIWQWCHDV